MSYRDTLLDLGAKPHDYFTQSRAEMIPFVPETAKKIIDIGCGKGELGEQVKAARQAEVWGLEIDPASAKVAETRLDKVLTGDIVALLPQLPDNYFDVIIFCDVLEHIVDPFSLLNEIKKKLTPGGVVVCSIPNMRYLLTLKALLINKDWHYTHEGVLDKTHLRFFTQKSIRDTFEALGFEIKTLVGINPIISYKFTILNLLSLGYLSDTRFIQFACVAKPK